MNIRNVAVEACLGIIVGKQTNILEFPAKDYCSISRKRWMSTNGRDILSTRKTIPLALEPSLGAAT
jgi:hypothetical protein